MTTTSTAPTEAPYRLSPLEAAGCVVLGADPAVSRLPAAVPGLTCRQALEQAILPALLRQPCLVSFSGGRDSSAVLALAAHVARREGLPAPIPVTMRFPACPDTDETAWQELVVRHLELPDWVRLNFDDELDQVGAYAQAVLERFGPLWPYNAHSHLPLAAQGPGGTLLTGFGGDELLSPSTSWVRVNEVMARRVRPVSRDVLRIAYAYDPSPLRRVVIRRQFGEVMWRPWLRADAQRRLTDAAVRQTADEPVRWDVRLDKAWWRTRYRTAAEDSLSRVGSMHEVLVASPLTDPRVLGALAKAGGRTGFRSRTAAMELLVGDLLPTEILARSSKAVMTAAFWTPRAAAFAAGWDGRGVDADLVDVEALRREWSQDGPADARTFCLLQSAWWATRQPMPVEAGPVDHVKR